MFDDDVRTTYAWWASAAVRQLFNAECEPLTAGCAIFGLATDPLYR